MRVRENEASHFVGNIMWTKEGTGVDEKHARLCNGERGVSEKCAYKIRIFRNSIEF